MLKLVLATEPYYFPINNYSITVFKIYEDTTTHSCYILFAKSVKEFLEKKTKENIVKEIQTIYIQFKV